MDPGLTTAAFGTKAQTAISTKNADLSHNMSSGTDKLTMTDQSGRKHTIATKRSTTTVTRTIPGSSGGSSRSSRETTPTRTGLSATERTEPLRHTLVRQSSPKTKSTVPPRSKTPSRALSPTGENKKTPRGTSSTPTAPSHIPKPARRPVSPSSTAHTATGIGPKPSGIPTPSRSKITKNNARPK